MTEWSHETSDFEAHRRAGGRRGYNARRAFERDARRLLVARMLAHDCTLSQSDIARALGVHRCTICRDVAALHEAWLAWAWGWGEE